MTMPIGPAEAARRLGVSTRTVQRWLREGRLPAVRVGSRLKVDASSLATDSGPSDAADTGAAHGVGAAHGLGPAHGDERVRGVKTARQLGRVRELEPARRLGLDAEVESSAGRSGGGGRPIHRLLVANRGELVVRIARTCRMLGIAAIALATEDQREAWWAAQVPESAALHGRYLDATAVLDAARRAGADAIHPGYGFLAENADFADAVLAAGLTWVGPPPAAMRLLGDKASGRHVAEAAGVPTVPGYDGEDQSDEALTRAAADIGYPLLVKPSGGGGGKGMHVVRAAEELAGELARARREARAAFGDDRLILERFIEGPRHVEVQFLRDAHGNAVHLGERDCSLQRRHQKVIEEAPSPVVDDELRATLGDAAIRLATAAGYVGAGTAEFLLDASGAFFFLEVNARLQVEHPVTEALTGRDLVADQLRIAAGEPLGFSQADVRWSGHAIEARLYAEDPWADFLPSAGRVVDVHWPAGNGGMVAGDSPDTDRGRGPNAGTSPDAGVAASPSAVRVDAGIGPGDAVGTRYDPLLAKVIAHGASRDEALSRLDRALAATAVFGVTTNRGFLRRLIALPEVVEGAATTDLVERAWHPEGDAIPEEAWAVAAAALWSMARSGTAAESGQAGFRLNSRPRLRVAIGDEERLMEIDARATARLPWAADEGAAPEIGVWLDADGRAIRASIAPPPTVDTALLHAQHETGGERVTAPMPGNVLAVRVADGDVVEAGQILLLLEAMKMEIAVPAPAPGTVAHVGVVPGQQVQRGDLLVELH